MKLRYEGLQCLCAVISLSYSLCNHSVCWFYKQINWPDAAVDLIRGNLSSMNHLIVTYLNIYKIIIPLTLRAYSHVFLPICKTSLKKCLWHISSDLTKFYRGSLTGAFFILLSSLTVSTPKHLNRTY